MNLLIFFCRYYEYLVIFSIPAFAIPFSLIIIGFPDPLCSDITDVGTIPGIADGPVRTDHVVQKSVPVPKLDWSHFYRYSILFKHEYVTKFLSDVVPKQDFD